MASNNVTAGTAGNGTAKIGSLHSNNWAAFANSSVFSNNSYALIQNNVGVTLLNAANNQYIGFRINNGDTMRLLSNGNFGINHTNPQEKLHVDGNIRCDGDTNVEGIITSYGRDATVNGVNTVGRVGADNGFNLSTPGDGVSSTSTPKM